MAEIEVIQVKRNISLSDEEPIYKDYYLSGGFNHGLKPNLVVSVNRWINLREKNQTLDQNLKILEPVGWLKIIYVKEQISIARLYESVQYSQSPILDQPGIMIGDTITLENSYPAKPNKKPPKDSYQVIEIQNTELPIAKIQSANIQLVKELGPVNQVIEDKIVPRKIEAEQQPESRKASENKTLKTPLEVSQNIGNSNSENQPAEGRSTDNQSTEIIPVDQEKPIKEPTTNPLKVNLKESI